MMTDVRQPAATGDNPNVALLAHAYARWAETKGGCAEEFFDMFADEVEMRTVLTPEIPDELAKVHFRKAEAEAYFRALAEQWEMIDYEVDRFIADADDIVMIGRCHWRNRATGREINSPKVDIWHFDQGKATNFLEMFDSLAFARAIGAI